MADDLAAELEDAALYVLTLRWIEDRARGWADDTGGPPRWPAELDAMTALERETWIRARHLAAALEHADHQLAELARPAPRTWRDRMWA